LISAARLLGYAAATSAALIIARLVWVWALLQVIQLYARWKHGGGDALPRRRLQFAAAIAGVRGAITLAGVLSVPLLMADGSPFPERSLMVFIAASVIVISMIAAAVGLPRLLHGLAVNDDREAGEEKLARLRACEAAIAAVANAARQANSTSPDRESASPVSAAATRVIDAYQQRLAGLQDTQDAEHGSMQTAASFNLMRLTGVRAERAEILRMHRADEINDTVLNALLYELDVREASLTFATSNGRT
jgi:CPA1 family monovalent cation:H+ antiporter